MFSLRDHIQDAAKNKTAIGHFNISTLDGIWAVADAAQELGVPVIIGVSEGERDYVGVREARAIVSAIRDERQQAIFLNADHTYSFERVKEAIDAGYDSVIFDGAQLSLEDNIRITKQCVEYAKAHAEGATSTPNALHPTPSLPLIEGELGYIGTSSKVLDSIPAGAAVTEAQMTKPSDAARFVTETGIDLLAPAIGNIHGMVKGGEPALNIRLAGEIRQAIAVPLVLHGASGNSAEDIAATVRNGAVIVHVNTELRIAYRTGLIRSLSENPDEVAPYKYLKPAKQAMQKTVADKIRIICGK